MKVDHVPAVPWHPRRSDDPMFRIQQLAESRARRNQREPILAGRAAMAMLKLVGIDHANLEHILSTVAGEYCRE